MSNKLTALGGLIALPRPKSETTTFAVPDQTDVARLQEWQLMLSAAQKALMLPVCLLAVSARSK